MKRKNAGWQKRVIGSPRRTQPPKRSAASFARSRPSKRTLLAADADKAYTEALQTIAGADAQDSIRTLYEEARRTATESDDRLVQHTISSIISWRKCRTRLRLRKTAQSLAQRRVDVENVRDRCRSSGYDHPNATFGTVCNRQNPTERRVNGRQAGASDARSTSRRHRSHTPSAGNDVSLLVPPLARHISAARITTLSACLTSHRSCERS